MKSPVIFRIFKDGQIQFVKQFSDKEQILIGRQTPNNENQVDVELDSADISMVHCLIEKRGEQYFVCDLGSEFGTKLNGAMVIDEALVSGNNIEVGPFKMMFLQVGAKPVASEATSVTTTTVATAPVVAAAVEPTSEISSLASEEKTAIKEDIVVPPAVEEKTQTTQVVVPESAPVQQQSAASVQTQTSAPVVEPSVTQAAPVQPPQQPTTVTAPEAQVSSQTAPAQVQPAAAPIQEPTQTQPAVQEEKKVVVEPVVKTGTTEPVTAAVATVAATGTVANQSMQKPVIDRPVYKTSQKVTNTYRKKQKDQKTYPAESAHSDLKQFIKPGKGNSVQVVISWKGRVLETKNFLGTGMYKAGPGLDISLPVGTVPAGWVLLDCSAGIQVRLTSDMKVELNKDQEIRQISDTAYNLQQGEVIYITFANGMQLAVRHTTVGALVPLDSPYVLTSTEVTGVLVALIVAALTSLLVSLFSPKPKPVDEEVQRVAQVIFSKPPVIPPPPPPPPPVEKPPVTPPEPPKPKVEEKKVIAEKEREQQNKGNPKLTDQKAKQAQRQGRAAEVKPKDPKNKAKMFTSTKQGGAVKTGDTAGANAKSKEPDPTSTGLLSAFGGGGVRQKLDKAYSGSGELLGAGEKATGSSGFNENRAGNDLGSKFKDTGAGGKGTATQGIAGVGTRGRGTGMSAFGTGDGFGEKDQVAVQAGGAEEEFVGSIDREAVRRAVRSALAAFKACYDREYKKNTSLEGKVVISWEIHAQGTPRNAKVVKDKTTLGNAIVEECVRNRMLTIRFPEPPTGTIAEVAYPFVFNGER